MEGTPLPPPLHKIPSGHEGEGQYLLPVQNTHSPVDVDLLGDINRLPERQRFTIILNEFGAGLAGRGSDLSDVIRRANPALQELDKVLQILASENHVLAKLAVDSDKALAPFARVREHVADFIVQSNTVAQASAATRGSLARNLALFPPFLEQLGPALERVQHFAEQTTPTFTDLKAAAPGIDKAFTSLPAFSKSSEKFFENLGKTAKVRARRWSAPSRCSNSWRSSAAPRCRSRPTSPRCSRACATPAASSGCWTSSSSAPAPPTATTRSGTSCAPRASANGCLDIHDRAPSDAGCRRKLFSSSGAASTATASAASAKRHRRDRRQTRACVMARTLAVIKGATPAAGDREIPRPRRRAPAKRAGRRAGGAAGSAQPVGGSTAGTTYYTPSQRRLRSRRPAAQLPARQRMTR